MNDAFRLTPDEWHTLSLTWSDKTCQLSVDGEVIDELHTEDFPANGLSYVRFRSMAEQVDESGFYVASVNADVGS